MFRAQNPVASVTGEAPDLLRASRKGRGAGSDLGPKQGV